MTAKRRLMLFCFWVPGVLSVVRVTLTLALMIQPSFGLPLRFLQVVCIIVHLFFSFTYFKLYSDGVPVVTMIVPTLVHVVLSYVFTKRIVVLPFLALLLTDIVYLVCKWIKATFFPFDVEYEEDDDLDDLEELLDKAG